MALISQPPTFQVVDADGNATAGWRPFFSAVSSLLTAMTLSGTTPMRPVSLLWTGRPYFDTTLGKPIWYKTAGWVDATGAAA